MSSTITFNTLTGFFVHEDIGADSAAIGAVPPRFGLKDDSSDRWRKLLSHVHYLNATAEDGALYKLFILGRHGQGYHNLAESKYGTKAWDDYWAKLNGDDEITWGPDPELTPLGKNQARDVNAMWKQEIQTGMPLPYFLYSSPFTRALHTLRITFGDFLCQTPRPLVLENCREVSGVHTCDKRRTRSYIASAFPEVDIEDGFTEEDEYYDDDVREPPESVVARARAVLVRIFEDREREFISITAHGGWINAFLTAVGRAHFALPTGGVLPLIVKCTSM
ncbi:phosphoglycerate mutase-like protein [Schizophyllum commune H4-8]|uniref:phosphoglycerate mutase-like protein n=1 Tax=Schizophyllum commune (strain H4-8 / FGSC 9210) TaxID=578458 RepID=UPI00215F9CDC|nr:phosphoglycerate mutase-like protein [Schizophyllum commune H4-8]KAI5888873.1 phosphoglycerate mutase-like protein [Schizophyllum commune H4-8]